MSVDYNAESEEIKISSKICYNAVKPIIDEIKEKLGDEYENDELSPENSAEDVEVFLNWDPTVYVGEETGPYVDDLMEAIADDLECIEAYDEHFDLKAGIKEAVENFILDKFNVNVYKD